MNDPIRRLAARLRYGNDYVRVWDDDVEFADGRTGTYVRIESARPGRGAVVLVRAAGRIAVVRTFRYPLGRWEWALPRGFADSESSVDTARREVGEELGPDGVAPVRIGPVTPDSGLMSTQVDVFRVALDRVPDSEPRDRAEVHDVAWVTDADLDRRIAAGEIGDAFTLAALTLDRVVR